MTTPDMNQGETTYAKRLDAISTGAYAPAARLRETDVAETLNWSRTAVHEALRRLKADAIVEHRPRLGAVIRQLDHNELVELNEMRAVLESTANEITTKHDSPAKTVALRALNKRIATRVPAIAGADLRTSLSHRLRVLGR